jgi:RNA polymerase sigma-70 factor (ECF subfamily)
VQDVFVRVLEHRRSLANVREMRVWLVRIAWNLALDRRRRIRPQQFDEGFAESLVARDLPVDEAWNEARRMKAVLREMERLPKAERHVLLLRCGRCSFVREPGCVSGWRKEEIGNEALYG